ncbi:helix-turn-helix domain-containing protein [uncultured Metabacillus sp.]|uniref:helix-turn-helix domain-containing protein n=1 Tax=uncultured Metabacillus sp. TaxID=2860135 RepID=UPI00262B48E9|nr:helix-turn-helix domain-containing protein [uncultured Metabacillus sp.]
MPLIRTVIVDDESRIRRRLERLVQSCGEEWEIIATFSDGKEALDEMTNESIDFDLLITDVQMPEMDGLTLVNQLKRTYSFTAVIVSGYDDFSYLQTAMREGAVNYILKPIDKIQFAEQMEEVKQKIYRKREEERQWSEVQEKASQLTYTKQIQFLSEVTWNDELDLSLIDWTEQFPKGTYKLAHISVDQYPSIFKAKDEAENWDRELEAIFTQSIECYTHWWWRSGKFQYWLLLLDKEVTDSAFDKKTSNAFTEAKGKVVRTTPFTVSIAISDKFNDMTLLTTIKDQLLSFLQYRIIEGGNKVFHTELVKQLSVQQSKTITASVYKHVQQIISALEGKSEAETKKALQGFFQEIGTIKSPALIEDAVHYLCLQIVNRWLEFAGFGETPDLLPGALQLTKRAANFYQLGDSIKLWVLQMKKKIDERKNEDSDPIQRAKDWIQQNLGENITIKKIAEHVYMSPTYFSNFFKAQTGETILDYVTKCRLEKAKDLLATTELKVYDISAQLGYQDTKYFSRLFKQWYGQSPSQYRELHFKMREQ